MKTGLITAELTPHGEQPIAHSWPHGLAYVFNDDWCLTSDDPAYGLQADFEFAALIKVDPGHNIDQVLFGKCSDGPTPDGWRLHYNYAAQSVSLSICDSAIPAEERCQSVPFSLGRWHVVRAYLTGEVGRIYIDGEEVEDDSFTPAIASVPFTVGKGFYGAISNLAIWARLLTQPERELIDRIGIDWPFISEH